MFPLCLTLLPLLVHLSCQKSYFCNLKCPMGGTNTVCKYEPCLPHTSCGEAYQMMQLNDEERVFVTSVHNELRNNVATGTDTQGGNGAASNMRAFSYSRELEFIAQCWANRCNQEGAHDKCRSIKDFEAVGQNQYRKSIQKETTQADLKRAIDAWYEEIKYTSADVIKKFKFNPKYGHFTQIVWAETQYVGCGRTIYGSNDKMNVLIICNYAIAGNFLGESVYKFGDGCSSCGGLSCNPAWKGLCGKARKLEDDKWKEPFKLGASSAQVSVGVILLLLILGVLCN